MTSPILAVLAADTEVRQSAAYRMQEADTRWRETIVAALATHTQSEVAAVAGITQARVNQIVHDKR